MNGRAVEFNPLQAEQTLARVREGLSRGETACVTQVLEIIQEMSDKADRLSVQDLADIIGRDLTTVAKIMRAANCLGYNPTAVDVTTLAEAINVIGFERIRNLAISLLLIENAEMRKEVKETQEVAALALSSALLAQVIVQQTSASNSDQAFVCTALRHYGKLLLGTFLAESYHTARELAPEMSPDSACARAFGIAPMELGRRILSEGHLPKVIAHSLQEASPDVVQGAHLSESDRLLVISEFSSRLCELIGAPETNAASLEAGVANLIKTYSSSVPLTSKEIKGMLVIVDQMIGTVGRAQGLKSFSNPLMNRIHDLAEGRSINSVARSIPAQETTGMDEGGARSPDPLSTGVSEVRKLVSAVPLEARRIFAVAARAVRDGLGLQSCLVFLKEEGGPLYAARIGSGALFEAIRNKPLLDPHRKDVFTVCLARGEDVLIQDPNDPKIAPFVPDWFKLLPNRGPFVLLPVKDSGGAFAIICGMSGRSVRIDLIGTRLQQIKTLRSHLAGLRDAMENLRAAA